MKKKIRFIVEEEIGVFAEGVDAVVKEVSKFYKNPRKIEYMSLNMKEMADKFSVDKIVDLIENVLQNNLTK